MSKPDNVVVEESIAAQPIENYAGPQRSNRALLITVLVLAVIGGAIAAFKMISAPAHADTPKAPENTGADSSAKPDPNVVKLEENQMKSITMEAVAEKSFHSEKSATGRIAFNEDATTPVFSPYTGRIVKLFAKPGDIVATGAPLYEIDTPDLVQAESDLIGAVSALKKSKSALNLAKRSEDISRRNIAYSERQIQLAQRNEARQKDLFENKAAAQRDWEQAQRDTQQAQHDAEQSQKDLEQALSDFKSAESDIAANETALNAMRDHLRVFGKTDAEIEKLETERVIDRITRVLSPISGTVTARKVGLGQYVKPDSPDPLFTITDLSTMWMLADVCEGDIPQIEVGHEVWVSVLAYPSDSFKARVSYINPSVDPVTRRAGVRCEIANDKKQLKAEMYASFRIMTSSAVTSPAIPAGALIREGGKKMCWVRRKENEFVKCEVVTGIEQDSCLQVTQGLRAGDMVVAQGGLLLSNNAD